MRKDYKHGMPEDVEAQAMAAERGGPCVRYRLGVAYYTGRGIQGDRARGIVWWRRAAEWGDARARCNLGVMYEFGRGTFKKTKTEAA